MLKIRLETVLAVAVLSVGLLFAGILGLWGYMSTTEPLHPDPSAVPSALHAPPPPRWADAVARADQLVRTSMTEQNLPGVSVAVGISGEIVWAEGFGWANLERRTPVSPATRFRLGTASTVLTSAAVGLLLEQGALELDEPIQTYVPAYPGKEWPVTLRQVMAHVAGIRSDAGDEEPLSVRCEATAEALPRFAERPLLFEPGTRYRFSSYDWILVSAAVEAASKEPFFAFMRRRVFEPLGMEHTEATTDVESVFDRAGYYFPRFAADPRYGPQENREIDLSCFAGSSAFLSTPLDLVRFGLAIERGSFLQPATVQLLQAPQRIASGEETGYGLGWDLETVEIAGEQTTVAGHDGDVMGGMLVSFLTFRDRGIVVAVTSNTAFADTFRLGVRVAEAFAEGRK